MSLIGLDIGTNACKAIAFDVQGQALAQASHEYPILTPQPGWAEQDAETVWQRAQDCLQRVISAVRRQDPPQALALSVQGEAVIPVDDAGRPLRPAILGMDTRTTAENRWLAERFGPEALFERTGMPIHTINTLPKLLWIQRHEPETWRRARRFVLYEDFILSRLGAGPVISHCLASRTQMYDLHQGTWAEDLLEACGIEVEHLAPLAPLEGGEVGELMPHLAQAWGCGKVSLASGGHDQACAALGSGILSAGQAMVSTGTAEVVEVALPSPQLSEGLRRANISVYRHVVPGLYLAMTLNHSGGLVLRWFRDALCPAERDAALAAGRDPYDAILQGAPEGPTPLLVLPHFVGSGTPWMDTASKGAILGLTFQTDRPTLAKAILEGLTFELRLNLDILREGGIAIEILHAVGGGARSNLWLHLKADICRLPLRVPHVTDAACLGAALLAGAAVGCYATLDEAASRAVFYRQEIAPNPSSAGDYEARYALYHQVYPTLAPLLHAL